MSFSETISPFFGRCAIVWFFGAAAMNIVYNWHSVATQLDAHHIPLTPLVLVVSLVLIVLGCISLLFGYHTRHGAVMLFGLIIVAAVTTHDFWHLPQGPARWADFEIFARDVAISGGLLLMVGMGAGPFALDNRTGKAGKKR